MTNAKILIVDDDHEEQIIFKELFNEQHFQSILYFDSAQLALAYLSHLNDTDLFPRLIISDINMPKVSGIELLRQICSNSRYKDIKVIMLSTANIREYGEECMRLGALEFIQKPNTYLEMKHLVRYLMTVTLDRPLSPYKRLPVYHIV